MYIFTLIDVDPVTPLQVMRKKNQAMPSTSSSQAPPQKAITKPSRIGGRSTTKRCTPTVCEIEAEGVGSVLTMGTGSVALTDESSTSDNSAKRSPTPLENDLLQYLTMHLTPPGPENGDPWVISDNSWFATSFDISTTEYLQGVVRQIQRDCPEAAQDSQHFLHMMEQAFVDVKAIDNLLK